MFRMAVKRAVGLVVKCLLRLVDEPDGEASGMIERDDLVI